MIVGSGLLAMCLIAPTACPPKPTPAPTSTNAPQSCTINLNQDPDDGHAFVNIRPNVDLNSSAAYREYTCDHFDSGGLVTATLNGRFEVSGVNTDGHQTGKGAGWVMIYFQIMPAPDAAKDANARVYYEECLGAPIVGSYGTEMCYATGDTGEFAIPAAAGSGWQTRGTNVATGFADSKGKVVFRISAFRVEQIHDAQQGAENHLVSAAKDATVVITAQPTTKK